MELSNDLIASVFSEFDHGSNFHSCKELTSGHINDTYYVEASGQYNYVLQRINNFVFKKSKELIINKVKVSDYLQKQLKHLSVEAFERRVLRFVRTRSGSPYYLDKDGNYWNLTFYIDGSKTFERVTNPTIAFEGGKLYGEFLNLAQGIDVSEIVDIIPNFHEMSFRYNQFEAALDQASRERKELAKECIQKVFDLKSEVHRLEHLKNEGKIPLCVTHNDTKISNALFDENDKGLCVIDTDTVMVGIVHYDFGDAIRTICNTAFEDEKDLSKVNFNLDYYEAFTKGFLQKIHNKVTEFDVFHFPLAAKTITFIMGLRMLTDFLNNDIYYKTSYENHNLVRTKNQFKLVDAITENENKMLEIAINTYRQLQA
jgi:hypothetical protein